MTFEDIHLNPYHVVRPCNIIGSWSDCKSRDCEFDPSPTPILSWRLIVKYFLPSQYHASSILRRAYVSYKRMCTKYWLACPGKVGGRLTDGCC